jgi:Uma2 family endonuclease
MEPRREREWKSRRQDGTWTAEDLLDLTSENGERYELIEGSLVVMEPPGVSHGFVECNVAFLITAHVREHGLGRVVTGDSGYMTRGDNRTVRAPDVAFLSYERFPQLPDGYGATPPDLVVEVLSPGDRRGEVERKVREWLRFGVGMVWVVDPRERRVRVSTADATSLYGAGDTLTGGDVLPGFAAPVAALFRD